VQVQVGWYLFDGFIDEEDLQLWTELANVINAIMINTFFQFVFCLTGHGASVFYLDLSSDQRARSQVTIPCDKTHDKRLQ
jgi:hypothetical protein